MSAAVMPLCSARGRFFLPSVIYFTNFTEGSIYTSLLLLHIMSRENYALAGS